MTKMLLSSVPVGRLLRATRCSMMNNALQRIASVMAICTPIRMAPTLLRRMAESMGRSSMVIPLLSFQLPGGLNLRGAPGRIQSREDGGEHRERHRDGNVRGAEMGQTVRLLREQRSQTHESQGRERQAQQTAYQADHPRLDQALAVYRPPTGAERPPHADVAGAPHDFRQHQTHGVQQTDHQEAERHQHEDAHFGGHRMLVSQPFPRVAYLGFWGPVKPAEAPLFRRIVVQKGAVALDVRRRRQLSPKLYPDTLRTQPAFPTRCGDGIDRK